MSTRTRRWRGRARSQRRTTTSLADWLPRLVITGNRGVDRRFLLVVSGAIFALIAAVQTVSRGLVLAAWIGVGLAWISQLNVADGAQRLFGPVWFRRAIYVSIGIMWLILPLLADEHSG
jgi:hypothetical protein